MELINNDLSKKQIDVSKSVITTGNKTGSDASAIPIGGKSNNAEVPVYIQLGITNEEYINLCNKFPDLPTKSIEEQKQFIKTQTERATETVKEDENTQQTSDTDNKSDNKSDVQNNQGMNDDKFDHAAFEKLSVEDKFKVCAEEYAKNKFMYSDKNIKKSEQEWNSLSNEEKQKLIEQAKISLKRIRGSIDGNSESLNESYMKNITNIETANHMGIDIDSFLKQSDIKRADDCHDYVVNLSEASPEKLSDGQKEYIKEQTMLSEAIVEAEKKSGKHPDIFKDDVSFVFSPSEAAKYMKELGTDSVEMKYTYLSNKSERTPDEEKLLQKVEKLYNSPVYKGIKKAAVSVAKTKSWDDFKKSGYFKDFEQLPIEQKEIRLKEYVKTLEKKLSPDKYYSVIENLSSEIAGHYEGYGIEIANKLFGDIVKDANPEIQDKLAESQKGANPELTALNVDKFGEHATKELLETQTNICATNPKRAEALAITSLLYVSGKQAADNNAYFSGNDSKTVQEKFVDRTHEEKNQKYQMEMTEGTKKCSKSSVIDYAASTADKLLPENQVNGLAILTKDSVSATKAATVANTITRFDKKNQTEGYKTLHNNIETLMNKKDAIKYGSALSDQIALCDKSNQLDMHKVTMTSKYSEVVEHAASNISHYDKSVQADAYKFTLSTGNDKAIEAATAKADRFDPAVQASLKTEIATVNKKIEAQALNETAEIYAQGNLDVQQYSGSNVNKATEQLIAEFKTHPDSMKWADILKLPSVYQKEAFVRLCKGSGAFLKTIINGGYISENIFSYDLPASVKDKIAGLMIDSNNISYQNAACKYIGKNIENTSIPESALTRYFMIMAESVQMTEAQKFMSKVLTALPNNYNGINKIKNELKNKNIAYDA